MTDLTIIIPTFNEESNDFFQKNLQTLSQLKNIEIIVSDGGSRDKTLNICQEFPIKIIRNTSDSRAQRINSAINVAQSPLLLIHHPRSQVEQRGIAFLLKNKNNLNWGGFTHKFDYAHPVLSFTSWYSNNIRAKKFGVVYLDHCIFFTKDKVNQVFPLPNVDIFEDTILSNRLSELYGSPQILPFKVLTSAIRFQKNGFLRQGFLNQMLKIKYFLGIDHKKLNQQYEKKIKLNSDYDSDYDKDE